MNTAEKAFSMLYPGKDSFNHEFIVKYSGKFNSYNANVRYHSGKYEFGLSREWRGIDEDIKIGLFQHLMQKIFKTNVKTMNQDLYDNFLRNVHIAAPKHTIEPELKESFEKVNERYFLGLVEMPNLVFGNSSFSKLGSYHYGSDTISISRAFKGIDERERHFLDYIMYHEMLHKVHKFKTKNRRSMHHTTKFRFAEKQFENAEKIEKEISKFLRKKKIKSYFGF